MNREVFITCAVTGSGETTAKSDKVPITPQQIAESAIDAAKAGAAVVHCHVRDPQTGAPSRDPDLFYEVTSRIRDSDTDVVLNLTAGMGGDLVLGGVDNPLPPAKEGTDMAGAEERLIHVAQCLPEICTLDCGTMNFGHGDYIMTNSTSMLVAMAGRMKELGVKPEIEAFDTNTLMAMVNAIPQGWVYSAFSIGRNAIAYPAAAILAGGNVRVGLEDNLYLSRGVFATNAQLVERAVGVIEHMGATVVGPDVVRERLALTKRAPARSK